ncbi:two component transcriptional regulator, AraC family [Paenibacillus curdlanolyticus YK9]|uniref:Two component transcriptional regulator, AraC family n=1 Tax=Paenibacillus curdlanolyticus YK9 TaxID=717606 RepID=E0I4I9_9BACL|nr:response regulator [Paenibacillus curdlanolyticus]EFM12520.1 two component transcriptional regulator, AraC family [Paenibacillus curdlanolyticus YK9]
MIKVLIVDDDKLVRKGLISAMPWQDFNMQVVGEASNGEKALAFLEDNEVDLLLTDIAMPVMTGMELMKIVRTRYPLMHVVVLTFHKDFEHIQEALRLGAIDYIAKVQLEKEQFEVVLGRIASRIQEQTRGVVAPPASLQEQSPIACTEGYLLLSLNRTEKRNWANALPFPAVEQMKELDSNCWLWLSPACGEEQLVQQMTQLLSALPDSMLVVLTDIKGMTDKEIQRWVRDYGLEMVCFYDYHPDRPIVTASIRRNDATTSSVDADERLEKLKEDWLSPNWLYHDSNFQQSLELLKQLRLAKANLLGFLFALVHEWNRLFSPNGLEKLQLRQSFHSWLQVEQWFREVRKQIVQSTVRSHFSQEIVDCIMRGTQIMQADMKQQLTAAEVAQRLNMSRSYFNQCFKEIIGHPFNEYLRKLRMDKAKEHLLFTNRTILWIAEETGYMDEKYFSRIFRDQVGMLPSEFRQYHRHQPKEGR